jgi:hypothetical protein
MTSHPKNGKHQKFAIDCAFGEKCSRRNCSFKHPDGWNVAANQHEIQQERRKNFAQLQFQERLRLMDRCRQGDSCRLLACRFQHSPDWNPKRNQQLFEETCRRNEQRREEQRKHAYDISTKEIIEEKNDLNNNRPLKKLSQKDLIGEEYDYDDEYFDIQEKVWEKQSVRYTY